MVDEVLQEAGSRARRYLAVVEVALDEGTDARGQSRVAAARDVVPGVVEVVLRERLDRGQDVGQGAKGPTTVAVPLAVDAQAVGSRSQAKGGGEKSDRLHVVFFVATASGTWPVNIDVSKVVDGL